MLVVVVHHSPQHSGVAGNPISQQASQLPPYNQTDPCIINCYGQCVPNNKCFYIPTGFVCKLYDKKCQMVCDEYYCASASKKCLGCADMVSELAYKYKTELLPTAPWTCKNRLRPATFSSNNDIGKMNSDKNLNLKRVI